MFFRIIPQEGDEIDNFIKFESMLWPVKGIPVDSGCEPRCKVASFCSHEPVLACDTKITELVCRDHLPFSLYHFCTILCVCGWVGVYVAGIVVIVPWL